MKTIKIELLKKNRKFFAAKTNGCNCKLVIDEKSENLELGNHELLVEDCSIRTKYGTDVIFRLEGKTIEGSICTLQHDRYNTQLVVRAKELGGKWDAETKTWVFSDLVAAEVEELDALYNDDTIIIDITAQRNICEGRGPVTFCGYVIARAFGRDSGAKLGDDVAQISGRIFSSGSMKNWATEIESGSKFRLRISKNLLAENLFGSETKDWTIESQIVIEVNNRI